MTTPQTTTTAPATTAPALRGLAAIAAKTTAVAARKSAPRSRVTRQEIVAVSVTITATGKTASAFVTGHNIEKRIAAHVGRTVSPESISGAVAALRTIKFDVEQRARVVWHDRVGIRTFEGDGFTGEVWRANDRADDFTEFLVKLDGDTIGNTRSWSSAESAAKDAFKGVGASIVSSRSKHALTVNSRPVAYRQDSVDKRTYRYLAAGEVGTFTIVRDSGIDTTESLFKRSLHIVDVAPVATETETATA